MYTPLNTHRWAWSRCVSNDAETSHAEWRVTSYRSGVRGWWRCAEQRSLGQACARPNAQFLGVGVEELSWVRNRAIEHASCLGQVLASAKIPPGKEREAVQARPAATLSREGRAHSQHFAGDLPGTLVHQHPQHPTAGRSARRPGLAHPTRDGEPEDCRPKRKGRRDRSPSGPFQRSLTRW